MGTAHVSSASAVLVDRVIRDQRPDTVCLELCNSRYETLTNPERWKETDLYSVIRDGRAYVLMAQLALAAFQRKLAREFKIRPGEEMHRAMQAAKATNAEIVLVDREIRTTLKARLVRRGLRRHGAHDLVPGGIDVQPRNRHGRRSRKTQGQRRTHGDAGRVFRCVTRS